MNAILASAALKLNGQAAAVGEGVCTRVLCAHASDTLV